jgi:hypothetical protein
MDICRFGHETQRNYIRDVGRFATSLGRSPDTATAEDVRRFQIEQSDLRSTHHRRCAEGRAGTDRGMSGRSAAWSRFTTTTPMPRPIPPTTAARHDQDPCDRSESAKKIVPNIAALNNASGQSNFLV